MEATNLNAYEKLQRPIELDSTGGRHRAALVTICTPVILLWMFELAPAELPLMSLAVAKTNPAVFWKIMLVLVLWAMLIYLVDLAFAFAKRRQLAAFVKQGIAYEFDMWVEPPDFGDPNAPEQRPPDDPDGYERWEKRAEEIGRYISKAEHYMLWFTRLWFPLTIGLSSVAFLSSKLVC